jgi:hypothetical protein
MPGAKICTSRQTLAGVLVDQILVRLPFLVSSDPGPALGEAHQPMAEVEGRQPPGENAAELPLSTRGGVEDNLSGIPVSQPRRPALVVGGQPRRQKAKARPIGDGAPSRHIRVWEGRR